MLADALYSHKGALSASLMAVYRVRLARHDLTALELADLVWEMPDGCALWQSVGGPRAWSQETQMLSRVEYGVRHLQWMQQGKKNAKKPKPIEPPDYAASAEAEEVRMSAKGDRWAARQAN